MECTGQTENWSGLGCPVRVIRPSTNQEGISEEIKDIICEAGGGKFLGTKKQDFEKARTFCSRCDIPSALTGEHACLYLVPFRVFTRDKAQSYYACRWFLTLNPQNVQKDTKWCRGCPYWFPRPFESLIPNQIRLSHKALQLFISPPPKLKQTSGWRIKIKSRRWYQKIGDALPWISYDKD